MNRILTMFFALTLGLSSFGQKNVSGKYFNYFGSKLILNRDSTYFYSWHFDLASSWSTGIWTVNNDTIRLFFNPIYDTIAILDSLDNAKYDKLILSSDKLVARITNWEAAATLLSGGGQYRNPNPNKLYFYKNRLYEIKDGKLSKDKIYCPFRQKKVKAYYEKEKSIKGNYN